MKLLSILILLPLSGPAQGWSTIPDFPGSARDDGVCFRVGEKAFCGTGLKVGWTASKDFYAFDPNEGTWRSVSKMPSGKERQYAASFSTESHGFVFGGLHNGHFFHDLWRYDPLSDEWREMPRLPAGGRSGTSCFRIGDTAYFIGGKTDKKDAVAEVWAYSIQEREWKEKERLPFEGVWNGSVASVRGKGYLLFGKDSSGRYKEDLYEYHPSTDTWERIGTFPAKGRTYSKLWGYQEQLYILGGMDSTGRIHGDLWRYDLEKRVWERMVAPPLEGRRGGMGFRGCYSLYYTTGLHTALERSKKGYKLHLPSTQAPPTLKLSPNPTSDQVVVRFDQPSFKENGKLQLIDRRGRKVKERPLHRCRFELDMREFSSGLYILRILGGEEPLRRKLLKVDR